MKKEYDFALGKRGAVYRTLPGKTRITIRIDDDILESFRAQVHVAGGGSYQALINQALRQHIESRGEPLKEALRSIVREELNKYGANQRTNLTKRSSGRAKHAGR
jgi:Arc/MetJ family transcription regulator